MQIPAKVHYAALALIELATAQDRPEPLSLREIVARHAIPQPFLVQILQQLKSAGWVSSTRGSSGGYRLTADMEQLSLLDIAEAVGWGGDGGGGGGGDPTANQWSLQVKQVWEEATAAYRSVLAGVSLADLVAQSADAESPMFYI